MSTPTELEQSILFEHLQSILSELYREVTNHLTITPKAHQPLQNFSNPDHSVIGSLQTFSGEKVDKLVYSWLKASQIKFGTMRLTLWLNSQIQVPHLAFEFGTIPNLFFYMDYIPRVDLWEESNYTDDYYKSLNTKYLELRDNPNLSLFISKALYIRQVQSPAHLCFTGTNTEESLTLVQNTAQEMFSRWLSWVEEATLLSLEDQEKLAKRDLRIRKISAERDPGNMTAAKIFGVDFANQLVQALWQPELPQSEA